MLIRRITILALEDCQVLDVAGPLEVFDGVRTYLPGAYAVEVVGPGGTITTSSGLTLGLAPLPTARAPRDTLIVAGGRGARHPAPEIVDWVAEAAPVTRRVTSVCTGAFVLGAAGLLDGRRATTHWRWCARLAQERPAAHVEHDPIFVRDGELWTSAGVTAGMDLALALVEDDLGRDVALQVARDLVLFLKRPGGQAQFSAALSAQAAGREPLRELQAWIADHLDEDLSVRALAGRVPMSERHFARAFRAEVGMTPAAYVESVRVERARAALQEGAGVDAAALAAGFSSAEVLRRAFHRRLGVGPSAYRERFRAAAA